MENIVAIATFQFSVTVPEASTLQELTQQLYALRLRDLLTSDGAEKQAIESSLTFDLEWLQATTLSGERLGADESACDQDMSADPGQLAYAGQHYLGSGDMYTALTIYIEPSINEWFWPLTGEAEMFGDKDVDHLDEGDHIVVCFPTRPAQRVTATLILPTHDDAVQGATGLSTLHKDKIGMRTVPPASWVYETLIKALLLK